MSSEHAGMAWDELSPSNTKPHVKRDGDPGLHPWTARVNPGSGMYTAGRRFPTWREAFDWLCDRLRDRQPDLCTCWVDEKYWFSHMGATEPGSQKEYDPECPEHGTTSIHSRSEKEASDA